MEVQNEEGPNSFTNITVNYELAEDVGFDCLDAVGVTLGTHQGLANNNLDHPGNTPNGDPIAIPEYGSDRNSVRNSDETFQVIKNNVEQSLEETRFYLKLEKTEGCPANEEHYQIVSELGSVENGNLAEANVLSPEYIVVEPIRDGEVIEINDSSEEETSDPVISSEYPLEGLALAELVSELGQKSDSFTVHEQPSSSGTQSNCTAEEEHGFKAFEDAMDDWYSKLSVHGPLTDCEIKESAQQLAQHLFNREFPTDAAWLAKFKARQKCKNVGNKTGHRCNSVAQKRDGYGGTGESAENHCKTNKMSSNCHTGQEPSSKKARKKGRTVEHLADLSRDADYPLLLISAQNAHTRGSLGENELFVSNTRKGRTTCVRKKGVGQSMTLMSVKECHSMSDVNAPSLSGGGNNSSCRDIKYQYISTKDLYEDPMVQFEALLLDWYFSLTSEHKVMVAASILESKAVEIARCQELLDFQPSKLWLKQFLGRHGMWCTLGEKRSLFKEPEAGFLKCRFDTEFEVWYHLFPTSPDAMLYYCEGLDKRPEFGLKVKKYVVGVFDWYVAQSSIASANEILTTEAMFAEIAGLSDAHVQLVTEFYREWCIRHDQFYESLKLVYDLDLPVLLPNLLKQAASFRARKYNFRGFAPSQLWMRRFLELNGLCYKEDGVSSWYAFDSFSCNFVTFERIFRCWCSCGATDVQRLRKVLQELFPQNSPEEPDTPLKIERSFTLQESFETT